MLQSLPRRSQHQIRCSCVLRTFLGFLHGPANVSTLGELRCAQAPRAPQVDVEQLPSSISAACEAHSSGLRHLAGRTEDPHPACVARHMAFDWRVERKQLGVCFLSIGCMCVCVCAYVLPAREKGRARRVGALGIGRLNWLAHPRVVPPLALSEGAATSPRPDCVRAASRMRAQY